jgi:hypothetical protein
MKYVSLATINEVHKVSASLCGTLTDMGKPANIETLLASDDPVAAVEAIRGQMSTAIDSLHAIFQKAADEGASADAAALRVAELDKDRAALTADRAALTKEKAAFEVAKSHHHHQDDQQKAAFEVAKSHHHHYQDDPSTSPAPPAPMWPDHHQDDAKIAADHAKAEADAAHKAEPKKVVPDPLF